MGSAAEYYAVTAWWRDYNIGASGHTFLVCRPVFFLAGCATIDDFLATATALELCCAYFSVVATRARALLQHARLHLWVIVRPVPDV